MNYEDVIQQAATFVLKEQYFTEEKEKRDDAEDDPISEIMDLFNKMENPV